MAEWTCAACDTHNDPSAYACIVCGGHTRAEPARPKPSTRRAAGTTDTTVLAPASRGRETAPIPPPRPARVAPFIAGIPAPPPATPPVSRPAEPRVLPTTVATVGAPPAKVRSFGRTAAGLVAGLMLAGGGAYLITENLTGGSGSDGSGSSHSGPGDPGGATAAAPTTKADNATFTTGPPPTRAPATATSPIHVGLVTVSRPSALANRAATMLDTYFSGINHHTPDQALAVFDPAGTFDPSDAGQADHFRHDVSTTRDDEIVLGTVTADGDVVTARVRFRSRQAAGFGPAGNPGQTCTRWSITYTLSDTGRELRILRGSGRPADC